MPPVDPLNGCTSLSPLPGDVNVAVKGGSPWASRTWSQRPKSGQGSLEPVEHLAPLLPLPSSVLSLLSGVFLNAILRITPLFLGCVPGRLFVAGNTFLSSPFLSLSLSFLLSFLSSPSSLGVPGCFVIAGSPSFWCVPGRMCRSWEHLCLLLSFPLFSSSPCPLFPRARRVYKQTRLLQQVFLMRFGLSSVCPRSFGSPFIGPHRRFFLFSFMSFCLHVSSSSSFLSLARTFVRTLVCTHTRTRTLLTARFRWPRFVTMRFGSSVVPLHLVPFHRQPRTPLSVLSFSFSSVPFARACAYLLSGQDGGHTCLPSGRRVCVTLGIIGILSDCFELLAGGRSRCKGLRLTKLPCIWEARSDQPGVPAFENLSTAKAVYFVVSFSKELLQRR